MHQALYRKYRPQTFDDVCGEEHVSSVLRYEAKMQKFSHAYLFFGPRGTGKTTCAKILAKVMNCESPVNGNPCGKCYSCTAIDSGTAPDVVEMDAASNTGVDYIRDIRDDVSFLPAMLKRRVYIIDEVHMLSVSAFNALLKTLEEPPEHVVFILATTELHKLPATIVSRCQRFDFRRIKTDVIAKRLSYIAGQEGIPLEPDAAKVIAKQSEGGMRDAISLFELCSSGGHDVTAERTTEILGLTDTELLYKTAVAVARRDTKTIFDIIRTVVSSSKDVAVYWSELTSFWRDMMVSKYLSDSETADYLDLTDPEIRVLNDAARRFTKEAITYHFGILDDALREMVRQPQTKRLTAELALIKMSDASLEASTESLLVRIASLEERIAVLESGVVIGADSPSTNKETSTQKQQTQPEDGAQSAVRTNEIPVSNPERSGETDRKAGTDDSTDELTIVEDFSDVIERVSEKNPRCAGFLADCECYINDDRTRVVIKAVGDLAKSVLSSDSAMQSIKSALLTCKIASPGAEVAVETGAQQKKRPPVDELLNL